MAVGGAGGGDRQPPADDQEGEDDKPLHAGNATASASIVLRCEEPCSTFHLAASHWMDDFRLPTTNGMVRVTWQRDAVVFATVGNLLLGRDEGYSCSDYWD